MFVCKWISMNFVINIHYCTLVDDAARQSFFQFRSKVKLLTAFEAASLLGRLICSVTWPLLDPFVIPDRAMVNEWLLCCVEEWSMSVAVFGQLTWNSTHPLTALTIDIFASGRLSPHISILPGQGVLLSMALVKESECRWIHNYVKHTRSCVLSWR
jgi:hypothetical protein